MKISLLFSTYIFSFFYVIFLLILYFSKARLDNTENKIYKKLLIINSIGVVIQIASELTMLFGIDILNMIVTKMLLIYFIVWIVLFFQYVLEISGVVKNNVRYINWAMILLATVGIIFLPYDAYINSTDGIYYTCGLDTKLTYLVSIIYTTLIILISSMKRKVISVKKAIPIYLLVFCFVVSGTIQFYAPEITIIVQFETFICLIMYFTIENPDVKMLQQVEVAKEQAEKANQAKSDFLSSMSHEIRTPLNAIVGFSESLKEENLTPSAMEEVNDIIDASQTLLETVNGILDISKIEANKIEIINSTYDFKKIFNELVSLSKARLGEDKPIEFKYHLAEDVPQFLYGDYIRVKQVILNFLTNAIKYTNEGYIDFNIRCINNQGICRLIIKVEDSGMGIKKENINKLFGKFERGENEHSTIEGTGLGLAITKRLVELMNGKIVVQSIYGKGSQFLVIIDQKIVEQPNVVVQNTTETTAITHDLSSKKILVVDDNKLNLKVAARLLKSYNVIVEEAQSGFECLDLIGGGNTYDLILMDDMMPKKSGKETFKELKSDPNFNIPVVILTANAIAGMKEEYLAEGFNDYLAKPIEKDELNRVIKEYLDK